MPERVTIEPLEERTLLAGNGLLGEYFNNSNFTGTVVRRTDAVVNFNWSTRSPVPGTIHRETFSVRWTGRVQAPASGTWTFALRSDEAARVYLNGQLLINHWTPHEARTRTNTVTLKAGKRYNIQIDYRDLTGRALAVLSWEGPGTSRQVIPTRYLYSVPLPEPEPEPDPEPVPDPDPQPPPPRSLPALRVAEDQRTLVDANGKPFFWTGDTAWELLNRTTREEVDLYLTTRAAQGFNVIQTTALGALDGFNHPNVFGDVPLAGDDPATPLVTPGADPNDPQQYDFWDHVDYVVAKAEALGIYIALAPTWGTHVRAGRFTEASAEAYGRFLGERYGDDPVIWLLGADSQAWAQESLHRAMARGLAIGAAGSEDHSKVLITYHPPDSDSSSFYVHNEPWLDFNMFQSGHGARDLPNYVFVERDLARAPAKPTLDSEPRYEDAPVGYSLANGRFDAFDVRQAAYWSVFAGAMGHTYGHVSVWQVYVPGRTSWGNPAEPWADTLADDGARAMGHLRMLMESRPLIGRVPDQGMLLDAYGGADHLRAIRGSSYAMIYAPTGREIRVNLGRISGANVVARWFDPRQGTWSEIGTFANVGTRTFVPPTSGRGQDWVLVLDGI